MIGGGRVEDLGKAFRGDPVDFETKRSAGRKCRRCCKAPRLGCSEILQQSDRRPGVGANLVHAGLLAIKFLNYDERKHHVVFIETERGMWVGQENAGIEYVVRGRQGASLSRRMCFRKRRRERSGMQAPGTWSLPCRTLWLGEEDL